MCVRIITNVSDLYKPEDGLVSIDVNNVDNEVVKRLEEYCKKIAEEDIVCYKVFTKVFATTMDGLSTVTYLTPFISVGLEMGVKYTAYGEVNFKEGTKVKTVSGMSDFLITEINGGVFHSFIDEEDAKMFAHRFPFASINRLDQIKKARGLNKKITNPVYERLTPFDFAYTFYKQGSTKISDWLENRGLNKDFCGLVHIPNMHIYSRPIKDREYK